MNKKNKKNTGFYVVTGFVILLLLVALLAPVLAPNDPYQTNLMVAQA